MFKRTLATLAATVVLGVAGGGIAQATSPVYQPKLTVATPPKNCDDNQPLPPYSSFRVGGATRS